MEKIIFFGLAIPIFALVIYLGGNAIMKGMRAKASNQEEEKENQEEEKDYPVNNDNDSISEELRKLNDLYKEGVLNEEEFEKAKKKILNN